MKKKLIILQFFILGIFSSFLYSQYDYYNSASVMLPNANIMMCGGVSGGGVTNRCTVILSTPNITTSGGDLHIITAMNTSRVNHTMTLLPDGRVLVAGGHTAIAFNNPANNFPKSLISTGTPTSSAEICLSSPPYTCTGIVNMLSQRAGHTATLLTYGQSAGDVLICGGQNNASGSISNSCEIFITSKTVFESGPNMTSQRFYHTASILPNGKVFVFGGITSLSPLGFSHTSEIYDPTQNTFDALIDPFYTSRVFHSATVLNNGNVLITGGYNNSNGEEMFSDDSPDVQTSQGQGTWGFIQNVEMFDQNGARVSLEVGLDKILPYRISNQFSLLQTNGKLIMMGGRGNIPVTYYSPNITFSDSSTLYLNPPTNVTDPTGIRIASIDSTTSDKKLQFEQSIDLSKPVTGRIINGDLFLGKTEDEPRLTAENLEWYGTAPSTATLDGIMVGDIDNRGKIDTILSLRNPSGNVYFAPITNLTGNNCNTNNNDIYVDANLNIISPSEIYIRIDSKLSDLYAGSVINGTATLTSATITLSSFTATITGGIGEITNASIDGEGNLITGDIRFSNLNGVVTCSTDTCNFPFTNFSASFSGIGFNLSFTSDKIDLSGQDYNVSGGTVVIRDMIFADIARLSPKDFTFDFDDDSILTLNNIDPYPLFDYNGVIRESGIPYIIGGRNCESDPESNCIRDNPQFDPSNTSFFETETISSWKDYGKLNTKRANHTTTVLNNGDVLVCGGTDGTQTLASCELYNSADNAWVIVSTMSEARSYHTATLLTNGTVLIAGGVHGDVNELMAMDSAEIYYPQTKTFVPTSNMKFQRAGHTQTLLPDGNVLITGGISSGNYSKTAEIFISTANTFIRVGDMATTRTKHTATLMKDGRVLIAGGSNNSVLKSCEIFNHQTNTFGSTGNLTYGRHSHTAHLMEDGRIVVFGGNSGIGATNIVEAFTGTQWKVLGDPSDGPISISNITSHSSILLPDKNIAITGGERLDKSGIIENEARIFLNEFYISMSGPEISFGDTGKTMSHSAALLPSNDVMITGGWDGQNYLDTTKGMYYLMFTPDAYGRDSLKRGTSPVTRKPLISNATTRFDRGEDIVIYSTSSNLHSISDASNDGSGGHNSDFAKPRIILRGINNEFMIDLSSQIYVSTSNTTDWNKTLSTITVRVPSDVNQLPYGWYYLYDCNSGICSDGYIVQASTPRPECTITGLAATESQSTTSIKWNWSLYDTTNSNGFAVFSASGVFVSTVSFPEPLSLPATYYQTGLLPNTPSKIQVGCYNIGGFSDPSRYAVAESTVYTKANPPKDLRVVYASFDTVELEWDANGNNPDYTPYQVEISTYSGFDEYAIAMDFVNNYKKTNLTIRNLEPNNRYYFRVMARNGNGIPTLYDSQYYTSPVSTITVGNITGLSGMPLTTQSIKWSWNKSGGATGYEVWRYLTKIEPILKTTTDVSVFLSSTTYPYFTQLNLSTNTAYQVKVRSYKKDPATYNELVMGPFSISEPVYTLAAVPAPASPNVYSEVSTGSFKVNWVSNGNDLDAYTTGVVNTSYRLEVSRDPAFLELSSFDITPDTSSPINISYVVTGLKPNYRYYSRVYAINKAGHTTDTPADLGSKYTLANAPLNVFVASVSVSGVRVGWDPGENSEETIYELRTTSMSFETPYISTPIPFSKQYVDTEYLVNGLWLKTTYYFDVAAMNKEGKETARIQTMTPAVTLGGPGEAPSSSILGLTDPENNVEISGKLSDGRSVVLSIPSDSFKTQQPIAVARLYDNKCGFTFGGSTIAFGIYSNEQPYVPMTFEFNYFYDEAINSSNPPDINSNISRVTLARYNPLTGQCLPVKTEINTGLRTITAIVNHLSVYQLIMVTPPTDLSNVKVFPNPFYPNRSGEGFITITGLPDKTTLTFYTLSGQKVYDTRADSTGIAYWDGMNSKEGKVASGIYLCVIKSPYGKKTIKIAIER
ncbi:MAG: T9SS type A sorting domain-containing protein [Elusimicrobia bacterium]|nr:T9SS type A sorting domain-containing protein [Elusimicrobiota bacterium]